MYFFFCLHLTYNPNGVQFSFGVWVHRIPYWSKFNLVQVGTCVQWPRVLHIEPNNVHKNLCIYA